MPTLETPDGRPVDVTRVDPDEVNRQFQAVMNDDGTDEHAPPRRQPAPPEQGAKPKRARADRSRTTGKPGEPAKPAQPVKDDYTEDAGKFVGGIWVVAASIPLTQPYAVVIDSNSDPLVKSLAEGAKHNETIRAFVTSGESSWILGLASITMTMGMQAFAIMRDPQLRAECAEATRKSLKEAMGAKGLQVPEPVAEAA